MSIHQVEDDIVVDTAFVMPKNEDIEYRISLVDTPFGGQYLDVREFVLSADRWGRGVTIPVTRGLITGLHAIADKAKA